MTTSVLRSRETAGNALSGLRSSYSSDRERPWPASSSAAAPRGSSSSNSPSSAAPRGADDLDGSPLAASVPRTSSALHRFDLGDVRGSQTESSSSTPSNGDLRALTSRATTVVESPSAHSSLPHPSAKSPDFSPRHGGRLSPTLKRRRASDDPPATHHHLEADDMAGPEDYLRRRRSPILSHDVTDREHPRKSQRLDDDGGSDRRPTSASPIHRPPKREEEDLDDDRRRELMRRDMEPSRELPPLGGGSGGYRGVPSRMSDRSEGPSPRLPSFASLSGPKESSGMPSILQSRMPGPSLGGHGPSRSRSSSISSPSMSRQTIPAPPAIHPSLAGLPGAGGGPGSKQQPSFVSKLYSMLEDRSLENMISWGPDGSVFSVANPADFSRVVLPNWFKHSNWQSFVRQLNMYGFHKVNHTYQGNPSEDVQVWEFKHPSFRRGEIQLLNDIKRKSSRHKRSASQSLATGGGPGSYDDGTARSLDGRSTPSPERPLAMDAMYGRDGHGPVYGDAKYERAMLEGRGHHQHHHHPAVLDGRGMPGTLTSPAMRMRGYPPAPPSMQPMGRPAPPSMEGGASYPAGGGAAVAARGSGGEPLPAPYYSHPLKEGVDGALGPATFSSEAAITRMDDLSDRIDAIIRHASYLESQLRTVTEQLHHSEQNEAEMVRHIQHLEVKVQDLTEQLARPSKAGGGTPTSTPVGAAGALSAPPSSVTRGGLALGATARPSGSSLGSDERLVAADARSPAGHNHGVGASPRARYGSGLPAPSSTFEERAGSSNASGPLPTPPASAQPYEYRGQGVGGSGSSSAYRASLDERERYARR